MFVLNVVMAGIDHSIAGLDLREQFSFTKTALKDTYDTLALNEEINGVIIISTCNRTEIYVSAEDGMEIEPFELLCDAAGIKSVEKPIYILREGEAALKHLCALASGMRSQIWGEDQIISQVKNSVTFAREQNATDSILEVMFRTAISAAKRIKTEIKLNSRESSVVVKAMEIIGEQENINNVLVIGNGEIGRLMAQTLKKSGYATSITLRHYKYSMNIVPEGVAVIEYNERYSQIELSDCVISATLSPHHTIEREELLKLKKHPRLLIDLAVPRDIDPEIHSVLGITLYDIDSMCKNEIEQNHMEQTIKAKRIMQKYIDDYNNWYSYKMKIANSI